MCYEMIATLPSGQRKRIEKWSQPEIVLPTQHKRSRDLSDLSQLEQGRRVLLASRG